MSDVAVPFEALRDQINSAIDVIVQLERAADGKRRIVEVAAVASARRDTFRLATVMRFQPDPAGAERSVTGRFLHYPLPELVRSRLTLAAQPWPPVFTVAQADAGPAAPVREAR
jgi:pilus assembly protein CpaF